jgi:hypothetical protein
LGKNNMAPSLETPQNKEVLGKRALSQLQEVFDELEDLNVGGRADLSSEDSKEYVKELQEIMKDASDAGALTGKLVERANAFISELQENIEPAEVIDFDARRAERQQEEAGRAAINEERTEKVKKQIADMKPVSKSDEAGEDWTKGAAASVKGPQPTPPEPKGWFARQLAKIRGNREADQ